MGLNNGLHNVPLRIEPGQSSLALPHFNTNTNSAYHKRKTSKHGISIWKQSHLISRNVNCLKINLDQHLNFNSHTEKVTKKIAETTSRIWKLKYFLPAKTLLSLYYSFIHWHLLCGVAIWGQSATTSTRHNWFLHLYPPITRKRRRRFNA